MDSATAGRPPLATVKEPRARLAYPGRNEDLPRSRIQIWADEIVGPVIFAAGTDILRSLGEALRRLKIDYRRGFVVSGRLIASKLQPA
jgi:hypothetical protein